MEYDLAFHLRCALTLGSGRKVLLRRLDQMMTYDGLLEGAPNTGLNDALVALAVQTAAQRCWTTGQRPLLLDPVRRDYLRAPGDMRDVRSERLPVEWLPLVTCSATFSSAPSSPEIESLLAVVWFQDEYGPPILEPALGQLLALDWDASAVEVER